MGTIAAAVGVTVLLTLAIPGDAQAFRCGSGLVRVGDTTGKVLVECGPPSYKEGAGTKTKAKSIKTEKAKDTSVKKLPGDVRGRWSGGSTTAGRAISSMS